MVFKDTLTLSFYLDGADPEELAALAALKTALDHRLRSAKLGRYDEDLFDEKLQFFKLDLLGQDAEAMLKAVLPLIREAYFLIGPRATLIMRKAGQGGKVEIKHVDL